jgi:hypothetical protein
VTTAREQLTEVLGRHFTDRDESSGCALRCGYDGDERTEHLADALLPLVNRLRAEAAVEAVKPFRALADEGDRMHGQVRTARIRALLVRTPRDTDPGSDQ